MIAQELKNINPRLEEIGNTIGNTPLLRVQSFAKSDQVSIHMKAEWQQFGGSVKSRPAYEIIREAYLSDKLTGKRLLDASSGNTAIAYASIGAKLGIGVTICLPENASASRITLLKALGAQILFSSPFGGTDEAQEMAKDLVKSHPQQYYYADQYSNDNNWKAHYYHTANEIWDQTGGKITHFVCGLGTTGSITGTSRRLKELNPDIKIIALQPDSGLHIMEGWKHLPSCRVPGIYDPFVIDEEVQITSEETIDWLKNAANSEGLILSPSSAANLAGASKVADQYDKGLVVSLFPDNGDKYLDFIQEYI
jgi:cysteine synthase B